jgi:beta-galactosidase/beta-glucuronidase
LEPVANGHVEKLKIAPDLDITSVSISVLAATAPANKMELKLEVMDGRHVVQTDSLKRDTSAANYILQSWNAILKLPKVKTWSPDSPFLYDLRVTVSADGKKTDEVKSYFAMRKISLGKDDHGHLRLCLNNKPYFMLGPLDQGFWPDGLYTAPTDEALRYDIEMTKKLGFNLARKHVKIEPDRWYYWCDKLGLLVWQDMPSGDKFIHGKDPDIQRSPESGQQFETELKALVEGRGNHPSIVMWVPYNEGWGQWDTCRIVDLIKQWDPTRLVNNASGWTDRGCGDVNDMHKYPGPGAPNPEEKRAGVLGEFGGLGLPVKGHTWQDEKNWGYRSFTNVEALTTAYVGLVEQLPGMVSSHGLSAAVYTQTTDVEIEVNGLMTYDRAMLKMDPAAIAAANRKVYGPPPDGGAQK